ncbi:MAG: hypothetical protein Kow0068_03130 [Marinilabiliales bacterium]
MKYLILFCSITIFLISCKNDSQNNVESTSNDTIVADTNSVIGITRLIRENPKNAALFAKRAQLQLQNGYTDDAINDITIALRLDSLNPDYYVKCAEIYLLQGNSGKAKEILDRSLELIPNNIETILKLAEIYLFIPDYKKAFEYLEKAKDINPNHPRIYFLAGINFADMGDTTKALDNLLIAVEKQPDFYDAYIMLGVLSAGKKDSLAIYYYDNALKIAPQSVEAHYNKAYYLQENGKPDKAIEIYKFIIDSLDSEYKYAYYNIGYINMVYYQNYDTAIEYFTNAIKLDNRYAEAYYNKGVCYEMKKDYKNARLEYEIALKMKNNYDKAIEGLNRIEGK